MEMESIHGRVKTRRGNHPVGWRMCIFWLILLPIATVHGARLTITLETTTLDPHVWESIKHDYVDSLEGYAHFWEPYELWGHSVSATDARVNFHFDLPYKQYSAFANAWNPHIAHLNAAMVSMGIEYIVRYEPGYTGLMDTFSGNFPGFVEVWHHLLWTPQLGYLYSAHYPYLYLYDLGEHGWIYAIISHGQYYYYIWGRGWIWTPDGSLANAVDL